MRRAPHLLVLVAFVAILAPRPALIAAQEDRKTAAGSQSGVKSQTIEVAPEVELVNGNGDMDPAGACKAEVAAHCLGITAGESKLADCLSDLIAESEMSEEGESDVSISDACREEVYQFKISRDSNINANVPLAKACKADAEAMCNMTWFFGYKAGQVIACLRDVQDRVGPGCKEELDKVKADAAQDLRADPILWKACESDTSSLCHDVKPGGGRIQACLRDHRMQLTWACEEQLFRQEVENADDVRLSVRLYKTCLKDKRKFCPDVSPGAARVKECLEKSRHEPEFTPECKTEVESMIERRTRDFRLDARLRTACEADIHSVCAFFGDLDSIDDDDSSVIYCLQDYVDELTKPMCAEQVRKYQELAAEDIRFDAPLADACYDDRQKLCGSVPPGSARVIRCLRNKRDSLNANCRAVLFDEEVRFSQNIDFQYPMRKACDKELKLYCKDVPHGEARAIRCLQDNKAQKDFGKACKDEVHEYEVEASSDHRLNYRLEKSCRQDIDALCKGVCSQAGGQICSGRVLRCLTENQHALKNEACQKEVYYFIKMEVTDYRNDVILAATCRGDVEKFCSAVQPGEGRVHDCLRLNRARLSKECKKEELLLEEQEAENVELRPGLLKKCKDERSMFCKTVAPGEARVFRCLTDYMNNQDFGDVCREEIISKLQRRQANWKLDPPLRKACKNAVQSMCEAEDREASEEGHVYKCLIRTWDDLDMGCQKELGRAVNMAFYVYQPSAILTSPCDGDIEKLCIPDRPNIAKTPGDVQKCLANVLNVMDRPRPPATSAAQSSSQSSLPSLSEGCRALVDVSESANRARELKKTFEASLSVVLLQNHLSAIEGATGVRMLDRDNSGTVRAVTLTGWYATFGMMALMIVIAWGASFAWRKYRGIPDAASGYTLVVKGRH